MAGAEAAPMSPRALAALVLTNESVSARSAVKAGTASFPQKTFEILAFNSLLIRLVDGATINP
jgi:hypothetical protein